MDPMVPALTGWLAGIVIREAKEAFKYVGFEVETNSSFIVTFASGLRLRVSVDQYVDGLVEKVLNPEPPGLFSRGIDTDAQEGE